MSKSKDDLARLKLNFVHEGYKNEYTHMRLGLKVWIKAHRARPLLQDVVRSMMWTLRNLLFKTR